MEFGEIVSMKDPALMSFEAVIGLIVYKLTDANESDGDGYYGHDSVPSNYVTIAKVRNGEFCEETAVSKRKLKELCKLVMPSAAEKAEYLPENILAYSPTANTLIWWLPGGLKTLFFEKSMGIKSGYAPVPPLLFYYYSGVFRVFALKESKRPEPGTEIFHTPFFNDTCMGTARIPRKASVSITRDIEEMFFGSEFTSHTPPCLNGTDGEKLWSSLVGTKGAVFPLECLVKAGTLDDIFSGKVRAYGN